MLLVLLLQYKNLLLDYKLCVCPTLFFRSKLLMFTPNLGHYTSKSRCSSLNDLFFTLESSSGYVPVSSIPSVYRGGWGWVCMREAHCTKIGGWVDFNGWVCAGVHKNMFVREIYCAKNNLPLNYSEPPFFTHTAITKVWLNMKR